MSTTTGHSVAQLPIELWDIIIHLSVPPSGLHRDVDYPWVDSPRQWRHEKELYRQRGLTISLLSQVCWSWRELSSTIGNQDLWITRGGRLSLALLLEQCGRNPSLFKETYRIRVHFPIKEDISVLIAFAQGIKSLTALELIIDDAGGASNIYKRRLRRHLLAILSATPSLIRLEVKHRLSEHRDMRGVLSTDMIGGFSDAAKHLRRLSCTLEVDSPYALGNAPSFPNLEILRIAICCDWTISSPHLVHAWFRCWKLPSLKQLSLIGYTGWSGWEMVLALLADNNIPNLKVFDEGVGGYYEVFAMLLTARSRVLPHIWSSMTNSGKAAQIFAYSSAPSYINSA